MGVSVCSGVWVCGCVCAGVWVWASMCVQVCGCGHVFAYVQCVGRFEPYIISLYCSNFLPFSPSLSLPSSHHLLISCLLQLKSLHPFAFGDSASDHSKMQGFVRQLQEVETHSTEYVKSVTYIPITHTHARSEICSDMSPSCDHPGTSWGRCTPMNTLNGSCWFFLSTVTLHPTPLHLTCTGVFTSPLVTHPSSLTTCSLTVSVPLSPQIRDGSRLSVHIILDDPAGNSYIQVAAK